MERKKINVDEIKGIFPFLIYQRINMIGAKNRFLFPIEAGYWFFLRFIRAKWAELDAAAATFAPEINIEVVESAVHRVHQNNPFPFRLITSPASHGVQINAGGQLTATGPRREKTLDEMRPYRDNITLLLSGQNATPFPAFVDVAVVGYMIPDKSCVEWKGSNNGEN